MCKKTLILIALVFSIPGWSAETTQTSNAFPEPTEEQTADQFRSDLKAHSADVMAKGLSLTPQQAEKFWPLFEAYQKERDSIVADQLSATQKFASGFPGISDEEALSYINALLDRDQKMHDLQVAWLKKFQTVVPPKIAARATQLQRRLGLVAQVKISSQVPLIQ